MARTNVVTKAEVWYIFDPVGDVAMRLDGTGQVLSLDRYDAFGNVLESGDSTDPVGYKGQYGYYTDHETGLILCTLRYYDPQAGRWMTPDPIGFAGGINLYEYCGGDPLNRIDQSRKNTDDITDEFYKNPPPGVTPAQYYYMTRIGCTAYEAQKFVDVCISSTKYQSQYNAHYLNYSWVGVWWDLVLVGHFL